jgi:lysophospholipase L1-like esterase
MAGAAIVVAGSAVAVGAAFWLSVGSTPREAPDGEALRSAAVKLEAANAEQAFRIEFTDEELTAAVLSTLDPNGAVRGLSIEAVGAAAGDRGHLTFRAELAAGGLVVSGRIDPTVEAGSVVTEVTEVSLGRAALPGAGTAAMREAVSDFIDVNAYLPRRADVQGVEVGDGVVAIVGIRATGVALETALPSEVAAAVREGAVRDPVVPDLAVGLPSEQLGPGVVSNWSRAGDRYYVALGDSLAASVGVRWMRDGYVSRFHRELEARTGERLGMQNFGRAGETSGSLLNEGQLDRALAFLADHEVAYVTIDVGANDLLGHIWSADCSTSLAAPACEERLEAALARYARNLDDIVREVVLAAPEATVVFLTAYNPFALGLAETAALETATSEVTRSLNELAAGVARRHGALVADGFGALEGRTGEVTHVLASEPDVHPNALGHDLLAVALAGSLPPGDD